MNLLSSYEEKAIALLKGLIRIPSFSKEESGTAALIKTFFREEEIAVQQEKNNIWVRNKYFDESKPTILLNSHHDTVKPNTGFSNDPFDPIEKDGKIFGLGSNDAGASLVCLIACFLYFYEKQEMKYNFIMAASAEEEISGRDGIELLLPVLPPIDAAIVGEPTGMQMAVAERGLMVLDCVAEGRAGHAARNEGLNAIYMAMDDIQTLQNLQFEKGSELLGPVTVSVTSIETSNKAHNVVPDSCSFIADVRINEMYTHEEVLNMIRSAIKSKADPRSCRLRSTNIGRDHPLVRAGLETGKTCFGSSTSSDKALMPFPALKIGPGDSARSHSADEFIFIDEIKNGISDYIQILNRVL